MRRLRWQYYRPTTPAHGPHTAVMLTVVFAALVVFTRFACVDAHNSTVIWPANGAIVVALLTLPQALSLRVVAACLAINLGVNALSSYSPVDDVLYAAMNIEISVCMALLTRRYCGARIDLSRFRRLIAFGIAAFASAALEVLVGELIDPDGTTRAEVVSGGLQWMLCDGLGLVVSIPAILLCVDGARGAFPCPAGRVERWALLAGTSCLTVVSFSIARSPCFMMLYPALILTAFRAGPSWVLASILITSLISAAMTAHGYGPFTLLSSPDLLLGQGMVQPFLVSLFLCAVPANNALGEKSRAARRLLQMKRAVEHAATHDTLTTLANRDLFRRRLGALPSGTEVAVLFIDLDGFKQVNDTMGHSAGDELLRAFSARVLGLAGPEMTVARFGGDEFAVLLPCGPDRPDPQEFSRAIIEVARTPFLLEGGPAHVSSSVGVAIGPGGTSDASELMRRADIALYAAKAAGRDGVRLFCDDLGRTTRDRIQLKADLQTALDEDGQLRLAYQAKVARDGTVNGVEALLRWHHPSRGVMPAADVIATAEETGAIVRLGAWVLREALDLAERWPALTVAVNVSPVELRHPRFVADLVAAVGRSSAAGRIELQIAESALMKDLDGVRGKLATLREAGILVALDGFGTGLLSLRYLHRGLLDRVRIDRSLVGALGLGEETAATIRTVTEFAHAMGLPVTAVGVETEAQLRFLREAGVDEFQGRWFDGRIECAWAHGEEVASPTATTAQPRSGALLRTPPEASREGVPCVTRSGSEADLLVAGLGPLAPA